MRVRIEDKRVIQYLALVGAVSGIIIALLAVFTERANALVQLEEERQYVKEHAPLLALSDSEVKSGDKQVSSEILSATKVELMERRARVYEMEEGFWARLPLWGLMAISIGAVGVGATLGYVLFWSVCWILTLIAFMLIRSLYRLFRKISPERIDAGGMLAQATGGPHCRQKRLLPLVIKWSIFAVAAIILIILLLRQNLIPLPDWLHVG
ncbi:MAG: hypothetical protein JXA82_13930 [Sedimentisphaerales bacterium]|nr:hypothetical protein [Sedimentisphaerales bacterium]